MIDFYFMIHYVMYRYYRRHNEDSLTSMITACCLHLIFSETLMIMGGGLLCRLLGYQSIINKPFIWSYIIIFAIFEFLVFFWKNRYLEIFGEYAKQIDTPAMKRKMKMPKYLIIVFSFSTLFCCLQLIILIIMADSIMFKNNIT